MGFAWKCRKCRKWQIIIYSKVVKNERIEARVSDEIKKQITKKAEVYGGITAFLEKIAKYDIVILDDNAGKLLKKMFRGDKDV